MSASGDEARQLFEAAEGRSVLGIITQGVSSVFSAVGVGVTRGVLGILSFLFVPFFIFRDVAFASAQAFLIDPLTGGTFPGLGAVPSPIQAGIAATSSAIIGLIGDAGALIGLPVGTTTVLVAFGIIAIFLSLGPTSDIVPGIFVDNRVYRFFFTTPEEEEEGS
ncbi:MAG: hypothetical protein ACOC8M_03085 [Guyparkeria sp.]